MKNIFNATEQDYKDAENYKGCKCGKCLKSANILVWWMITCQICGNKRCPHATNCGLECSGSNAPGQKGSNYE